MVKQETIQGEEYFICGECGFAYEERKWAEKCQKWCEEHKSCNTEITKHATQIGGC